MSKFSEGMRHRDMFAGLTWTEEQRLAKICAGCVRFTLRKEGEFGHFCTMRGRSEDVFPEDVACRDYWDKEAQEKLDAQKMADIEARRAELHAVYENKPPVKLPIEYDGYGYIPKCPVCGEHAYSTEQCYWCGQHFIQDKEIEEYNKPKTEPMTCPNCGKQGTAVLSRYNGHRHFKCEHCGAVIME